MIDDERLAEVTRRLRARADGILAAAWFMTEARDGFPGIDLAPSSAGLASRAACLGAVRGEAVAALFAPINPANVAAALDAAWEVTTADELLEILTPWARAVVTSSPRPRAAT